MIPALTVKVRPFPLVSWPRLAVFANSSLQPFVPYVTLEIAFGIHLPVEVSVCPNFDGP